MADSKTKPDDIKLAGTEVETNVTVVTDNTDAPAVDVEPTYESSEQTLDDGTILTTYGERIA